MILVDVNILIYAVNKDAPLHRRARALLEEILSGNEAVGLAWSVILAFLRVTTRPGLFRHALPLDTAFDLILSWFGQPVVAIVEPGPRHFTTLRQLLIPFGTAGNLTSDAHLAALAIEQGAELLSSDNDFVRFPGLKWRNPLA